MALVEAALFYNRMEAALARSRLESDAIPAYLFDMEMSGLAMLSPIRLMVDEEDLDEARRILAEAGKPQER